MIHAIAIGHVAPEHMQDLPIDTTSPFVYAQVDGWMFSSTLIHTETAKAIAAWYQVPTDPFAMFASTGTITDDLLTETRNAAEVVGNDLFALRAYLLACTVTVWSVGHNSPGCLPDGGGFATLDYESALSVYRQDVSDAPTDLTTDADGGDCSDDGPCDNTTIDDGFCEYHALEAEVGAYLADLRTDARDQVDQSISLRPESSGVSTEYFLQSDTMLLSEYESDD